MVSLCVFCCRPYKYGDKSPLNEIVQKTFEQFCVEILNISREKSFLPGDFTLCKECLFLSGKAIACDMEIADVERRVEQLSPGMVTDMRTLKRYMAWLLMDVNFIADVVSHSKVPTGENSHLMETIRQEVFKVVKSLTNYKKTITMGLPLPPLSRRKVGGAVFSADSDQEDDPPAESNTTKDPIPNTGFMCGECQTNFGFENRFEAHLMRKENKMCKRKHHLSIWLDILQKTNLSV